MHVPINVKSPNNTSKWQMGFNSAFKGLTFAKALRTNKQQKRPGKFYIFIKTCSERNYWVKKRISAGKTGRTVALL